MKILLQNMLADALKRAEDAGLLSLPAAIDIHVEITRDPKFGDFASNIALDLAKVCARSPMALAHLLVAHIPANQSVAEISVAPPGFINFRMAPEAFFQVLATILSEKEKHGRLFPKKPKRIHVEFVSSNPTGPLHIGHGRHAAFGASLCNILEMAGHKVHREYYVNDAGRQMRTLAISVWLRYLMLFQCEIPFPQDGYLGDYVIAKARALKAKHGARFVREKDKIMQNMPEHESTDSKAYMQALTARAIAVLGKADFKQIRDLCLDTILADMQSDLAAFHVHYDCWFHESTLYQTKALARALDLLREKGCLYESDGALWFRATDFGDDKDRVVIRANQEPTYFATDIAYHLDKFQRGFDTIIDIFGSDHHGYMPRIQAFIKALGLDTQKMEMLLVQFAVLYRGENKVAMSTRGGQFITLKALCKEVGNDAARFFYIMRRHDQHLPFDMELAKTHSHDNPVYYIQYAHARICSVFRQLLQKGWDFQPNKSLSTLAHLKQSHEQVLMRHLAQYRDKIHASAAAREPAILAHYLLALAKIVHGYYNATPFLVSQKDVRSARLNLLSATKQILQNGLKLLGLSAPERM